MSGMYITKIQYRFGYSVLVQESIIHDTSR